MKLRVKHGGIFPRSAFWAGGVFALTLMVLAEPLRADYPGWQAQHFSPEERADPGVSGPDRDLDGDGMSNLLEYAFGCDPKVAETNRLPLIQVEGGYLTLTHRFLADRTDLVYTLQSSQTLSGWVLQNEPVVLGSQAQGGFFLRTLRDSQPVSASPRRFLRLAVFRDPDGDGLLDLGPAGLTAGPHPVLPLKLEWRDRSNIELGFVLQKREGVTGTWADLAVLGADLSSYVDSQAEARHEYWYRVAALFETDPPGPETSDWSEELQVAPGVALLEGQVDASWQDPYAILLGWGLFPGAAATGWNAGMEASG